MSPSNATRDCVWCHHLFNFDRERRNVHNSCFAFYQTALFSAEDMFGDGSLGTDTEVARDLSVGWFVSVLREKASDVIEDFFLALRTWQHVYFSIEVSRILSAQL